MSEYDYTVELFEYVLIHYGTNGAGNTIPQRKTLIGTPPTCPLLHAVKPVYNRHPSVNITNM